MKPMGNSGSVKRELCDLGGGGGRAPRKKFLLHKCKQRSLEDNNNESRVYKARVREGRKVAFVAKAQ